MNKQEYNNVIGISVQKQSGTNDSLQITREALNNMGVVLPQGDLKQVSDGLATDNYMGWRKCTVKEAQEYANEGTAVVAVSEDKIALVAANEDEGKVAVNSSAVMTLDENTPVLAVADMAFYANSRSGTTPSSDTPLFFDWLLDRSLIISSNIKKTTDGFYFIVRSLATILKVAGVTQLIDPNDNAVSVNSFCDDYYLYTIDTEAGNVFGLLKMREREESSTEEEGVTISFVEFEADTLKNCLQYPSSYTYKWVLYNEIQRVMSVQAEAYSQDIYEYFSNAASKASYCIADAYIERIAKTVQNGYILAPKTYTRLMEKVRTLEYGTSEWERHMRVPNALIQLNEEAGYNVFVSERNSEGDVVLWKICINNPSNLTVYEKYAILMAYTANVNKNSFAAEVWYHAKAMPFFPPNSSIYNRCLRADMILDPGGIMTSLADNYYDLDSNMVQEQERLHGYC